MSSPESQRLNTGFWRQCADDINSVFERDPAARNWLEVLLTYPGVHAVLFYRVSHWLWIRNWRFTARWLSFMARMFSNVDIHPGAQIGCRFFIDHGACVVIGETAVVGDDVTLYHGVTLGGTSWNKGKRHPTLGNGVMVGAGAKILGNITVNDGARVGANSVVVEDVPEGCTVVGIPGKVVRLREAGKLNPYGIDLDHHLIPDPVGKAISCMLERIDALEAMVTQQSAEERYRDCEVDNDVCEKECPGARIASVVNR
ncbi:serine O-acetyltransferase [Oceanobacter mangrovi]|uniref:serine O-acetyltransferase n=1 Tax=Oceanobacter mangrovi TaxID=2862510 RepID=UPI001C8D12B1|nr:serine O-acetyltransferase [Oceanobacter mangrovi]